MFEFVSVVNWYVYCLSLQKFKHLEHMFENMRKAFSHIFEASRKFSDSTVGHSSSSDSGVCEEHLEGNGDQCSQYITNLGILMS